MPGCGGSPTGGAGEFVESLVRLLDARFVPSTVVIPRGASRTVDFEVTCDKAGLDTVFGRLEIRVKLDPERRLPEGIIAALVDAVPADAEGFRRYPCNGPHSESLRIAHLPVRVQAAGNAGLTTVTLVGYVEVEPVTPGAPSKDSTRSDLAVTVIVGEGTSPTS